MSADRLRAIREAATAPYLADPDVTLYQGDALAILRELPDESVHCVATSPPFYGLRDYGVDGQIGLEDTPDLWAARLVEVFREARRVLRRDGSLWVECGDSYAANVRSGRGIQDSEGYAPNSWTGKRATGIGTTGAHPTKPKDLIGQPFLLAFALRADGWYWRGTNIWAKPNAMPESAKDRCTVAHSYVLHFSKSARYFFDGDAVREPHQEPERSSGKPESRTMKYQSHDLDLERGRPGITRNAYAEVREYNPLGRAPRSVWTIPTQGFPEAHFATWPEALARRIILAAVPEQVCQVCGKARERITDVSYGKSPVHGAGSTVRKRNEGDDVHGMAGEAYPRLQRNAETVGFTDCGHNAYTPGTVLDPFSGSGTTAYVARKHNRRAIGIDLNEAYLEMAARRLAQQSLFAEPAA